MSSGTGPIAYLWCSRARHPGPGHAEDPGLLAQDPLMITTGGVAFWPELPQIAPVP